MRGSTLHGGEVDPLMDRAGRHTAVPDVHQSDSRLAPQPEGEGDAGHHGDHVAEVGDLAEGAPLEIVEVDVHHPTMGRAPSLALVLAPDAAGPRCPDAHGAQASPPP